MVICEPTACPHCMEFDREVVATKDMVIGENAPMFHPNCRCSTAAYMDRREVEQLFAEYEEALGLHDEQPLNNPLISIQARNPADGTGAGIYFGHAKLTKRQQAIDKKLPKAGMMVEFNKRDIKIKDLSALTAKNGCEYALFTRRGKRILARGNESNAMLSEADLIDLAKDGWRFSGHTHPGVGQIVRFSSQGDINVLKLFQQEQSVIYDSVGGFSLFDRESVDHGNG